jgi:hypothetical protein
MYGMSPCGQYLLTRFSEMKDMNQKIVMLQEQIALFISSAASGPPTTQGVLPATPGSIPCPEQTNRPLNSSQKEAASNPQVRPKLYVSRNPQYMGPTSSAFTFGVAKSSLQRMGIQSGTDLPDDGPESYMTTPARTPVPSNDVLQIWYPLLAIPRNETIRLIEVYEEESGTIYSFLDIKLILKSAHDFYNNANAIRESSIPRGPVDENTLSGGIVDILKLVIAIALVIEGRGKSTRSAKLLETVESGFNARPCGSSVDMLEIQAWTLMVCW